MFAFIKTRKTSLEEEGNAMKTHRKETPPHHSTEPPLAPASPAPKPPSLFHDLDFWRFVLAALSLAWEIAKTWVR